MVQVYARFPASAVPRPRLALVAFQRVPLDPSESREVRLAVRAAELMHWNDVSRRFTLEPGPVELLAGPSSATLPLTVTITAV